MPKTIEQLKAEGAVECTVGSRRKRNPRLTKAQRLAQWKWTRQRDMTTRELLDPILNGSVPQQPIVLEKPHTGTLAMVITKADRGLFFLKELFK